MVEVSVLIGVSSQAPDPGIFAYVRTYVLMSVWPRSCLSSSCSTVVCIVRLGGAAHVSLGTLILGFVSRRYMHLSHSIFISVLVFLFLHAYCHGVR